MRAYRTVTVGLALAIAGVAQQPADEAPLQAFHDGETVNIRLASAPKGSVVKAGPWRLGTRVKQTKHGKPDKISDRRINLYFVVPGTQYQSRAAEFDHNLIVNLAPPEGQPVEVEADLFWVAVIDPTVSLDAKSETDLITLAQQEFVPGDLFAVDDIPADAFLREVARIETMADLNRYRKQDGALPRILILPAQAILSVTIAKP